MVAARLSGRLVYEKAVDLAYNRLRIINPWEVARTWDPVEAQARVSRYNGFRCIGTSEGVALSPQEERRHPQRLPAFAEDQLSTDASAKRSHTAHQAEKALDVPARRLELLVGEGELAARRKNWKAPPARPEDGRGYDLALTRTGRAMRKKMWPVYEAEIERVFSRHVTAEEARAIGEALGRAVKAVRN